MKVEASKNNSVERKEAKNVFKTEESVFNSSNSPKITEKVPTPGAFAKILEETRRENAKNNSSLPKNGSAEHDSKTSEAERDEKTSRAVDEKKELEERGGKKGDGDARHNGEENQSPGLAVLHLLNAADMDADAPAARSILHVADLERIVACIRGETFQNQKQVVIALKNSVLQGLQIKLTLEANGKVKAEFLAAGKQIKKQLEQRKNELSKILHNRSALFSEIEIDSQNAGEQD
ncbi:MAG TPA: hypothetical protein VGC97_16210 [Pyrinomonadaceae bacterium]|jgi:hypothetical protein